MKIQPLINTGNLQALYGTINAMSRDEIGKEHETIVGYNCFTDAPEMLTNEGKALLFGAAEQKIIHSL